MHVMTYGCNEDPDDDVTDKCLEDCGHYHDDCEIVPDEFSCIPGGCDTNSTVMTAISSPTSAEFEVLQTKSTLSVSVEGETGKTYLSGEIMFSGGYCPAWSPDSVCLMQIEFIRLLGTDFSVGGHPVDECRLINNGSFYAIVSNSGYFIIPHEMVFSIRFLLDNELGGVNFTTQGLATGYIDFDLGTITLTGSGTLNGRGSGDLYIEAQVVNWPPVAVPGESYDIECTQNAGLAILDGTASYDPDGPEEIVLFGWIEDYATDWEKPLGAGSTIDVSLPLGDHNISLLVFDDRSRGVNIINVSVVDTQPPVISLVDAYPLCLWPPNHEYVLYELERDIIVEAVDACDPDPPIIRIIDVRSSDQNDEIGDGSTVQDFIFNESIVCIRAERSGTEIRGRTYEILISIADINGNVTLKTISIIVPHDARDKDRCRKISPGLYKEDVSVCQELTAEREALSEGNDEKPNEKYQESASPNVGCGIDINNVGKGIYLFAICIMFVFYRKRRITTC